MQLDFNATPETDVRFLQNYRTFMWLPLGGLKQVCRV